MKSMLIRHIDDALYKAVKVRAAERGETLRDAILKLLAYYIC